MRNFRRIAPRPLTRSANPARLGAVMASRGLARPPDRVDFNFRRARCGIIYRLRCRNLGARNRNKINHHDTTTLREERARSASKTRSHFGNVQRTVFLGVPSWFWHFCLPWCRRAVVVSDASVFSRRFWQGEPRAPGGRLFASLRLKLETQKDDNCWEFRRTACQPANCG